MALVWIAIELMVLFLFFEFPPVNDKEENDGESNPSPSSVVKPPSPDCRTNADDVDDKLDHVTSDQSYFSSESKGNSGQFQITSEDCRNATDYRTPDPNLSDEKSPLVYQASPLSPPRLTELQNLLGMDQPHLMVHPMVQLRTVLIRKTWRILRPWIQVL